MQKPLVDSILDKLTSGGRVSVVCWHLQHLIFVQFTSSQSTCNYFDLNLACTLQAYYIMSGCRWNSVLCLHFLVTSTLFHDTIFDSGLAKFIEHYIATLLIQASHLHLLFFILAPWSYLIPLYWKVLEKEISWKGEISSFLICWGNLLPGE